MKSQELKSSILKYAVEGKLVSQVRDDEPANLLVEKIKIERQNLITEKVLKREKNLPPLSNNEIPFKIPSSWEWVRLGEISNIGSFKSVTKDLINDNDWVLDLEDIESNSGVLLKKTAKKQKSVNSNKYTFKKNNVMYGKLRPYLNKVIIAEDSGYCTTEILPLDFGSFIYHKYAQYVLMSPFFLNYVNRCSYGVKMPRLGSNDSKVAPFPLPPFKEQKRIVKKIEELFQKVNQYDYLEQKLTVLNDNFPNNMERSVLQCAMRGNLVPQDSTEGTAQQLLEKLVVKKSELIRNKVIPKQLESLPIFINETYFDIPDSWEWVRLNQIGGIVSGGTPKSNEPTFWDEKGIIWITPKDMGQNKNLLISNSARKISSLGLEKSSAKLIPKGSIVYSSRAPIGYINIVKKEYTTNQGCKSVVPLVYDKYIYYALKFFTPEIIKNASGTTFKEISGSKFAQTLLPLPPEKEQYRIVEKIEKLLDQTKKLSFL